MIQAIADTIRGLAADMVQTANSGHPGMPLGTADIAAVLFSEFLNHDPHFPHWPNRDRFVLSAGHGSTLLYALLHLTGYKLSMDDLKRFRQTDSITPGHPEVGVTPGVETTTGPLGQGIGNAVGMALAEQMLAVRFNRPGFEIVDHFTYVIAGDGCLMEGISSEACSLAGHLSLGKLILIYDHNEISIEGSTTLAFGEDVAARYEAYHWRVIKVDGHNPEEIRNALRTARQYDGRPTLIIAKTKIAYGSALEGNAEAHGAPLGRENVAQLKRKLGLPEEKFAVFEAIRDFYRQKQTEWSACRQTWEEKFSAWSEQYPILRSEWDRIMNRRLPSDLLTSIPLFEPGSSLATRDAGGKILNVLAAKMPELVGGSADLAPSTKTALKDGGDIASGKFEGRNLHFGVREHAMGSMLNGMSLHGGFRVYGSTFLVFADYMRPPIRLASLMREPVIYVFTHDSFWVGEDGPTHQPVEQMESLRMIPGMTVIRPADANETVFAWEEALQHLDGPTALILSRQKLPTLRGTSRDGFKRGGYIISEPTEGQSDLAILASGSEVGLALDAAAILGETGIRVRVVSVPCREKFEIQDAEYLHTVTDRFPEGRLPVVAIEAGIGGGWHRLVGRDGLVIAMDRFGASGPAEELAAKFGFTPQSVAERIRNFINIKD